jgi:hypothetical protein
MRNPKPGTEPPPILLFEAIFRGYKLRLWIEQGIVYLQRNEHLTGQALPKEATSFEIGVQWWTAGLLVGVRADNAELPTGRATEHPRELVPPSVELWVRRHTLAPIESYDSPQHFFNRLLDGLRQLDWGIHKSAAQGAFWNSFSSDNGVEKTPKLEPEIVRTLHLAMQDQAMLAGYQLIQEGLAGSGKLDWRATAPLKGGGLVTVCIEAKKADSADLEHGIEKQLPEYMSSAGADFGVYLVLSFKSPTYPHPKEDKFTMNGRLMKLRPMAEIMAVEWVDLSHPVPPSRL